MVWKIAPIWAWIFAATCMVVPILTVMSGYPAICIVVGTASALACIFTSHISLSVVSRVFLCSLFTAGAWMLYEWYALIEIFEAVSQIH